jgi:hypothetical protein
MGRKAVYVSCVTAEFRASGGGGGGSDDDGDNCNRIATVIAGFNISAFLT